MSKIKGILFDFDGVILNSDYTYMILVSELLSTSYDYKISVEEAKKRWLGVKGRKIAQDLKEEGIKNTDNIVNDLRRIFLVMQVDERVKVKDVDQTLEQLKDIPKGICSNGIALRVNSNLRDLSLEDHFDFVYGRDTFGISKPDPTAYIKGAQKLGLDIKDCLVIDDSSIGLQAGILSGATTVAFTGTGTDKEKLKLLGPDYIIDNLIELVDIVNSLK